MTNLRERLIQAGFAVELEPGSYNLINSMDNYLDDGVWELDLKANAEGFVTLPGGARMQFDSYNIITGLLCETQVSGTNNGFTHGASLLTDEEIGEDLETLRELGIIRARLDLPSGGLLVGSAALADAAYYSGVDRSEIAQDYRDGKFSLREFGFSGEDTFYAVVTPDRAPIDVYEYPGDPVVPR